MATRSDRNAWQVKRDIVVIGASAGGVQALSVIVQTLPSDLPAAVFIVNHIAPWLPSKLPEILASSGPLTTQHARDNDRIEHGRIYVAPPDHHLLLEGDHTVLWKGPRENRFRPSINTLFRSAAGACGERVVGVMLTGALDDGSAGLWWINRHGGVAVVQDPDEAEFSEMPRSALQYVPSAYVARLSEIGSFLTHLSRGEELMWERKKRA